MRLDVGNIEWAMPRLRLIGGGSIRRGLLCAGPKPLHQAINVGAGQQRIHQRQYNDVVGVQVAARGRFLVQRLAHFHNEHCLPEQIPGPTNELFHRLHRYLRAVEFHFARRSGWTARDLD